MIPANAKITCASLSRSAKSESCSRFVIPGSLFDGPARNWLKRLTARRLMETGWASPAELPLTPVQILPLDGNAPVLRESRRETVARHRSSNSPARRMR